MDFDRNLGAYPLENYTQWVHMTDYIDSKVIERLQPISGVKEAERTVLSE